MADGGVNIFVYMGGEQEVPMNVIHVLIDRSVEIIPRRAFLGRTNLVSVEFHDGVTRVERQAFYMCISLRRLEMLGVVVVEYEVFKYCSALTDVECGDRLETIGMEAFSNCRSLSNINMPTVKNIGVSAFLDCEQLTDVELPAIETIGQYAFYRCLRLRRILIALDENIFPLDPLVQRYTQFDECHYLSTVHLVGETHNTISSLLLESWRNEMNQEIDHINQVLPNTHAGGKAAEIRLWIRSVISRMEHYTAEHRALLKEDMTQLELALWKAKLDDNDDDDSITRRAIIDTAGARNERRINSGASIVITNVLPFLQLG